MINNFLIIHTLSMASVEYYFFMINILNDTNNDDNKDKLNNNPLDFNADH